MSVLRSIWLEAMRLPAAFKYPTWTETEPPPAATPSVRIVAAAAAITPGRQGRMAAALEALLEAVIRKLEAAPEGLMPVSLVTFPEILNSPNTGLA